MVRGIVNKIHNKRQAGAHAKLQEEAAVRADEAAANPRTPLIPRQQRIVECESQIFRRAYPIHSCDAGRVAEQQQRAACRRKRENKVHINFCVAPASARRHLIV